MRTVLAGFVAIMIAGVINLYAGDTFKVTVQMEDGKKFEVTEFQNPFDANNSLKIKGRTIAFDEIKYIKFTGAPKMLMQSDGSIVTCRKATIYLNDGRTMSAELRGLEKIVNQSDAMKGKVNAGDIAQLNFTQRT